MESDIPHILILLGPFVDINNKIVGAGVEGLEK